MSNGLNPPRKVRLKKGQAPQEKGLHAVSKYSDTLLQTSESIQEFIDLITSSCRLSNVTTCDPRVSLHALPLASPTARFTLCVRSDWPLSSGPCRSGTEWFLVVSDLILLMIIYIHSYKNIQKQSTIFGGN